MSTTKQRILTKATDLFNRFGYVNVRLQHIADEAELSVGNLAYHFKTKDAIFEAIYDEIKVKQQELLADLRIVPLFVNIDSHIKNTFQVQRQYSFFYSDTFEILRAFPLIKKKHREYTKYFISQIDFMLNFNASRGAFIPELQEGQFQTLATQYWMTMELWLYQSRIRGLEDISVEQYEAALWALLQPYFTNSGTREYQQMKAYKNFNWL